MQIGSVTNFSASSKIKNLSPNTSKSVSSDSSNIFSKTDKVELSDKKLKLDSLMGDTNNDGVISLDEIQGSIDSDLACVKSIFSKVASDLGIDPSSNISLTRDYQGNIRVKGNLENKDELEQYLNENQEFSQKFARLSANSSLVAAAKEGAKFQAAYAQNPVKAVAQYSYLFNNNRKWDFMLNINNTEFLPEVKTGL